MVFSETSEVGVVVGTSCCEPAECSSIMVRLLDEAVPVREFSSILLSVGCKLRSSMEEGGVLSLRLEFVLEPLDGDGEEE